MKKSFRLFAAVFAAAIIVTAIGAAVVRRHNVNQGDMYDVLAKGLSFGEPLYAFAEAERTDIGGFDNFTDEGYVTYQLNEFNTIELYAKSCSAEITGGTSGDVLVVSLDYPDKDEGKVKLHTAVKDGRLYIQNEWTEKPSADYGEVTVQIFIPDDYKGGYDIFGDSARIKLGNAESSMKMSFNLHNCNVSAENITAADITADMSGTTANIKSAVSKDGFTVGAVSSDIKMEEIEAVYSKAAVSSSTLDITNIIGAFSCESDISRLYLYCGTVTGNITLRSNKGIAKITLPKNAPVYIHRSERFSVFRDKTDNAQYDEKNKDSRYILETNVEFTIVTLEKK